MKKTIIYTLVLINSLFITQLKAQYTVTTSTGTYTDLVSPTIIASGATFQPTYVISISGSFLFFDKAYGFDTKSNGQGTNFFPGASILNYSTPSTSTVSELTLFGNCGFTGKDATSSLSYLVTGDTKTGTIKFQWKNMLIKKSGNANDYINVQLWLNRADNSFTYIFGPHQITGKSAFGTHGATCIGIDQFDGGFNSILASAYLTGDSSSPTVVTGARSFTTDPATLKGIPAEGTMYTFKFPHTHTAGIDELMSQNLPDFNIYPNPANNSMKVGYTVANKADVRISITDIAGKEIKAINEGTKTEGNYENDIEVGDLKTGIYYCNVMTGGINRTQKIIISH